MRSKRNRATPDPRELRERLHSDLHRLGLAEAQIECVARRLEPMLPSLSIDAYSGLLAGVAAIAGGPERAGAAAEPLLDVADVERLMQGVREEVQKLDEGLRMLSAYVTGLRRSSQRRDDEPLH